MESELEVKQITVNFRNDETVQGPGMDVFDFSSFAEHGLLLPTYWDKDSTNRAVAGEGGAGYIVGTPTVGDSTSNMVLMLAPIIESTFNDFEEQRKYSKSGRIGNVITVRQIDVRVRRTCLGVDSLMNDVDMDDNMDNAPAVLADNDRGCTVTGLSIILVKGYNRRPSYNLNELYNGNSNFFTRYRANPIYQIPDELKTSGNCCRILKELRFPSQLDRPGSTDFAYFSIKLNEKIQLTDLSPDNDYSNYYACFPGNNIIMLLNTAGLFGYPMDMLHGTYTIYYTDA